MNQDNKELAVIENNTGAVSIFSDMATFENAQRMCRMLASSEFVPVKFQGEKNMSNVVIALEMAQRIGASPLAIMQSLYIVHGRPSWSASFIIASLNSCGRYSPLRFEMTEPQPVEDVEYISTYYDNNRNKRTKKHTESICNVECYAWATEKKTGEKLCGPPVSIKMAVLEGWYSKAGSKWQTMPELMLRYRAATLFGRLYAPEILMGMRTVEESQDIEAVEHHQPANKGAEAVQPETNLDAVLGGVDTETGEVLSTKHPHSKKDWPKDDSEKPAKHETKVDSFKGEIDLIKNSKHLDNWRAKHHKRIVRELKSTDDQNLVFAYAEQRYQELKASEGKENPPINEATGKDGKPEMIMCPHGMEVAAADCHGCDEKQGCPAHEGEEIDIG